MSPPVALLPADISLLDAAIEGDDALGRALGGYKVAPGWQVFSEALPVIRDAAVEDPKSLRWGPRFFVREEGRTLVGWGGFKGPPVTGVVELGYSVAPEQRDRGIATAAVEEMVREAFAAPEVMAVVAHTMGKPGPSARVLEKAGFARDPDGVQDDSGAIWRFRLDRPTR